MDAYFDCFSGISGDMVLGALLYLGVPVSFLKESLSSLSIGGFDIVAKKDKRESIAGTNYSIMFYKKPEIRGLLEIVDIINSSGLSKSVKQQSVKIFDCLANAESKVHKCNKNEVHFHEIGALDSITDIVGSIVCIEYLDIKNIISSALPLGMGFVKCSHGILPLPSPATLEILKDVPVYSGRVEGELVTPTGAGIISSLAHHFGKFPNMLVKKVGYGCGKTIITGHPNILRVILGDFKESFYLTKTDSVSVIETNIDDMSPEIFGFVIEKLFSLGALDVCFIPVTMKKGRVGIKIEVICSKNLRSRIIKELFLQTTTLGVRYYSVKRDILKRRTTTIQTQELGSVKVKLSVQNNGIKRYLPEYSVCKAIAEKKDLPIKTVYDIVTSAAHRLQSIE